MLTVGFLLAVLGNTVASEPCTFTLARLKYGGGGDWYANPSSLPNLVKACITSTDLPICDSIVTVSISDERLFNYPFVYMTGHGEVRFTEQERIRLRRYLVGGGFLWADDNFGMDASFRREIAELFPDNPLVELPSSHPIYKSRYVLEGLPKIHEHDGKPAAGYGLFFDNRMLLYYSYSSDIGDGMENLDVHHDGEKLHELALKMGINVIYWFFNP